MRKFEFYKLVRDKIAANIIKDGGFVGYGELPNRDHIAALKAKLVEESKELREAETDKVINEIADVQEIIDCIIDLVGVSREEIASIRANKKEKAGSFEKGIFIYTVEVPDDYPYITDYLADPERYLEITDKTE
jgi:predicted house-cleaning noncanonical NTP pyrophosphatase (MazG superfamily)